MRMMMSNLPCDLVEEIISRVPLKSLKLVRSTCKKWNVLSKEQIFADKLLVKTAATRDKEFLMIIAGKRTFDLISINLHGLDDKNINLSIKHKGKLPSQSIWGPIPPKTSGSSVFHCNGLLALVSDSSIVVWNPYWGKTRWIPHINKCSMFQSFAFGYDRSCGSHKILRICFDNKLEIYDLSSSNSWRILNATLDQNIVMCYYTRLCSVSVKGNTYMLAMDNDEQGYLFLLCFDFTREIFGPHLPLPFNGISELNAPLYSVKEEKLAMLHFGDIWITNKVEYDAVSWSKFLKYEMVQLPNKLEFEYFMIDEEKKAAVIFYQGDGSYKKAYLFGKDGSVMCTRKYPYTRTCTLICSFVPSSLQIK